MSVGFKHGICSVVSGRRVSAFPPWCWCRDMAVEGFAFGGIVDVFHRCVWTELRKHHSSTYFVQIFLIICLSLRSNVAAVEGNVEA